MMGNKRSNLYVVYQTVDGNFEFENIEIVGKVNRLTVINALRKKLRDVSVLQIISWQESEEFSAFEIQEYWESQRKK